ncbi:FMN-binding protein [Actinocrispum sp. NPDC049592]|uniref:FMN-binding protein n=1 Tax=Actinocrispum sp. NPDC049592 TaxID=3154835 RepID=UPI00342E8053
MRRVIPAIVLSAIGFYFVWQYEPGAADDVVAQPPPTVIPSTPAPTTSSSSSSGTTSTPVETTKTVQGSAERNPHGTVQVQVTFTGDKITGVRFLRLPDTGPSRMAGPLLVQETLREQSAQVDTVSGATQTSDSYVKSLQAAIDAKGA